MLVKSYYPGVWDMLHVGHVRALQLARQMSDVLIVGVPSDEVVRQDKGQLPIIPLAERIYMLESLKCVTAAVPYYHLEFITALEGIRPNRLIVGPQWGTDKRHKDAEEWAIANKCIIRDVNYWKPQSTTKIKNKVIEQHARSLS